eukprot:SM000076S21761  [mRNA]  locus=s76:112687:117281:+ [translate_table: standard]
MAHSARSREPWPDGVGPSFASDVAAIEGLSSEVARGSSEWPRETALAKSLLPAPAVQRSSSTAVLEAEVQREEALQQSAAQPTVPADAALEDCKWGLQSSERQEDNGQGQRCSAAVVYVEMTQQQDSRDKAGTEALDDDFRGGAAASGCTKLSTPDVAAVVGDVAALQAVAAQQRAPEYGFAADADPKAALQKVPSTHPASGPAKDAQAAAEAQEEKTEQCLGGKLGLLPDDGSMLQDKVTEGEEVLPAPGVMEPVQRRKDLAGGNTRFSLGGRVAELGKAAACGVVIHGDIKDALQGEGAVKAELSSDRVAAAATPLPTASQAVPSTALASVPAKDGEAAAEAQEQESLQDTLSKGEEVPVLTEPSYWRDAMPGDNSEVGLEVRIAENVKATACGGVIHGSAEDALQGKGSVKKEQPSGCAAAAKGGVVPGAGAVAIVVKAAAGGELAMAIVDWPCLLNSSSTTSGAMQAARRGLPTGSLRSGVELLCAATALGTAEDATKLWTCFQAPAGRAAGERHSLPAQQRQLAGFGTAPAFGDKDVAGSGGSSGSQSSRAGRRAYYRRAPGATAAAAAEALVFESLALADPFMDSPPSSTPPKDMRPPPSAAPLPSPLSEGTGADGGGNSSNGGGRKSARRTLVWSSQPGPPNGSHPNAIIASGSGADAPPQQDSPPPREAIEAVAVVAAVIASTEQNAAAADTVLQPEPAERLQQPTLPHPAAGGLGHDQPALVQDQPAVQPDTRPAISEDGHPEQAQDDQGASDPLTETEAMPDAATTAVTGESVEVPAPENVAKATDGAPCQVRSAPAEPYRSPATKELPRAPAALALPSVGKKAVLELGGLLHDFPQAALPRLRIPRPSIAGDGAAPASRVVAKPALRLSSQQAPLVTGLWGAASDGSGAGGGGGDADDCLSTGSRATSADPVGGAAPKVTPPTTPKSAKKNLVAWKTTSPPKAEGWVASGGSDDDEQDIVLAVKAARVYPTSPTNSGAEARNVSQYLSGGGSEPKTPRMGQPWPSPPRSATPEPVRRVTASPLRSPPRRSPGQDGNYTRNAVEGWQSDKENKHDAGSHKYSYAYQGRGASWKQRTAGSGDDPEGPLREDDGYERTIYPVQGRTEKPCASAMSFYMTAFDPLH